MHYYETKCWFCGEWVTVSEIVESGECWRCDLALRSRGEK